MYKHKHSRVTVLVHISLICNLFQKGLQFYIEIKLLNVLCPLKVLVTLLSSATSSRKQKVKLTFLTIDLKKKKCSSSKYDQDTEENPLSA